MGILESQLEAWSNQGAVVNSASTHNSVRIALELYEWPEGMPYLPYLQGSYGNSTNVRGNSDVDLVVETDSVSYSNLTDEEKTLLGITRGDFGFSEFRGHVLQALYDYFGHEKIDASGDKSIKIVAEGNRLKCDVVPAVRYKKYKDLNVVAEGIKLFGQKTKIQIINYPKLHKSNGSDKNGPKRTNGWYKKTVRMFKNARDRIVETSPHLEGKYPSYFIESLLYNVPDRLFGISLRLTYLNVVTHLLDQHQSGLLPNFICQNGHQLLFGTESTQWATNDAYDLLDQLAQLWNNWK